MRLIQDTHVIDMGQACYDQDSWPFWVSKLFIFSMLLLAKTDRWELETIDYMESNMLVIGGHWW